MSRLRLETNEGLAPGVYRPYRGYHVARIGGRVAWLYRDWSEAQARAHEEAGIEACRFAVRRSRVSGMRGWFWMVAPAEVMPSRDEGPVCSSCRRPWREGCCT